MSAHEDLMMEALKEHFLPGMRERGFRGSFPHFRRKRRYRIDYVMIQFRRGGGSFTINIGQSGPGGLTDGPWADLPIQKLTVGHLSARDRVSTGFWGGQWFEYGPSSYDDPKPARPPEFYLCMARKALLRFDKDAEPWFEKPRTHECGCPSAVTHFKPRLSGSADQAEAAVRGVAIFKEIAILGTRRGVT